MSATDECGGDTRRVMLVAGGTGSIVSVSRQGMIN
jgi:hypothetical protein